MAKIGSKEAQLRGLRDAKRPVRDGEGARVRGSLAEAGPEAQPEPCDSGASVPGEVRADLPAGSGLGDVPPKSVVGDGGFDRKAYQREYMKNVYRPRKKALREGGG